MTYTREQVEAMLPAVLGEMYERAGAGTDRPLVRSRCKRCDPGKDKCTHRCDLDQWGEGCIISFEGEEFGVCRHVHNGRREGRCGVCWCFSPHDRRATVNPKTGNAAVAMLADVRRAWEEAPLLQLHRRRLFLRYALDWTQVEIAEQEGVVQSNVARAIKAGLDTLVDYLNN